MFEIEQKIFGNSQFLYTLVENGQFYYLTKDLLSNELSKPYNYINQNILQSTKQLKQSKNFFNELQCRIQNPFNILINQKIRSLLIDLFSVGITIPEILKFIKITNDKVCFQEIVEFEQLLQKKFRQIQFFQRIEQKYLNYLLQSDEQIIQITLEYVYNTLKKEIHKYEQYLNSLQNLENQINSVDIEQFSQAGKQIFNLLHQIQQEYFHYKGTQINKQQTQIQNNQIIKNNEIPEQSIIIDYKECQELNKNSKQFIFKFFLLILVEKEVILPNLIKLIRLRENRNQFSKNIYQNRQIEIIISSSVLLQLSMLQHIKEIINKLQIDPSDHYAEKQNYKIIQAEIIQNYPQFLQINFMESIILALQLILKKTEQNIEQLQEVFSDQIVIDLIQKIEKQYLQQFKEFEYSQLCFQNQTQDSQNKRGFEICYLLYEISTKIKIHSLQPRDLDQFIENQQSSSMRDDQSFKQKKIKIEKSIYIKQIIPFKTINSIFFQFISKLTDNNIPFPLLLLHLRLSDTRLFLRYPIECVRNFTQKKKFIQFVKEEYGLEMQEDKYINVEMLKQIDKSKYQRKDGCFWYRILYQQCKLIYENKEYFINKLKYISKMKKFSDLVKYCNNEYETNPIHLKFQKALSKLIDYINQIKN